MTLVLADDENDAVAPDDLAFLAHRLDRRSYLHDPFRLVLRRPGSGCRKRPPLPGRGSALVHAKTPAPQAESRILAGFSLPSPRARRPCPTPAAPAAGATA